MCYALYLLYQYLLYFAALSQYTDLFTDAYTLVGPSIPVKWITKEKLANELEEALNDKQVIHFTCMCIVRVEY